MTRHLTFDGLCNFRDLGGYSTTDGRSTRWGRLYRSDSLGKLSSPMTWHGSGRSVSGR